MQSGSLAVGDAKTGDANLHYGDQPAGPGASAENPAGVFPQSSTQEGVRSHQGQVDQPMQPGLAPNQAPAVPQAAGGVPGTGDPDDTASDPRVIFGNPMLFSELMMKLSGTLTETIKAIDQEAGPGIGGVGRQLQEKFKGWRNEVDMMRKGKAVVAPEDKGNVERNTEEGGLFTD